MASVDLVVIDAMWKDTMAVILCLPLLDTAAASLLAAIRRGRSAGRRGLFDG